MCFIAAVYIKSSVKSELGASVALRNGLCSVTGSKPACCGSHDGDVLPVCASGSTATLGMARVPLKHSLPLVGRALSFDVDSAVETCSPCSSVCVCVDSAANLTSLARPSIFVDLSPHVAFCKISLKLFIARN